MPRSPKDNQEIRDARHQEILAAATRVFAEKGFARTKISEIAAAAGLSHGLVYHYFDSKDAILAAIVDSMIERIDRDLEAAEGSPLTRLRTCLDRSCCRARATELPDASHLVSQAMMMGGIPEAIRERLRSHLVSARARVIAMIEAAQESGEVAAGHDAAELADALICCVRGMSIRMPGMAVLPFGIPGVETILRLLPPGPAHRSASRGPTPPASRSALKTPTASTAAPAGKKRRDAERRALAARGPHHGSR